ncbi:MAG: TolC family protein, partial [Terriglobales bacterium]
MNRLRACLLALCLIATPAWAQFMGRIHMVPPKLEPVTGLDARIHNGDLHLTLKDFLALVLTNDTQIHIFQLQAYTAQDAVLAARSPFDPNLTASFGSTRSVTAQASQTSGAATLSSLGQNTQLSYNQTLATGQQVQLNFGSNRNSSNSQFSTFNPSIGANLGFSLTQPLLRNRGNLQNRTGLLLARAQVIVTGDQTQTQIADELVSAADQYWNTVQARDQITVQQQAVDLAQKSYERDQNALKLGALAPGDIFTSQAQVAQDKTALLQSQSNYAQQLDQLRRLMGADLDPAARAATLVLDDDPSAATPAPPTLAAEDAVAQALLRRPEMDAIHRQRLEDALSLAQSRDALR